MKAYVNMETNIVGKSKMVAMRDLFVPLELEVLGDDPYTIIFSEDSIFVRSRKTGECVRYREN